MQAIQDRIIIRVYEDPPMLGELYLPISHNMPCLGVAVSCGRDVQEVLPGEVVVIEMNAIETPQTYIPTLFVTFSDGSRMVADVEIEPVLREVKPREHVTVRDLAGSEWSFRGDEVVSIEIGERPNPVYNFETPAEVLHIFHRDRKQFYVVSEKAILCSLDIGEVE